MAAYSIIFHSLKKILYGNNRNSFLLIKVSLWFTEALIFNKYCNYLIIKVKIYFLFFKSPLLEVFINYICKESFICFHFSVYFKEKNFLKCEIHFLFSPLILALLCIHTMFIYKVILALVTKWMHQMHKKYV